MHPSTANIMRYFEHEHLRPGPLQSTSRMFWALAQDMVQRLPEGPELTACLRKLLEAKDCAVRAALDLPREGE